LFEFHSDVWLNLHQRLFAEANANERWHVRVPACPCGAEVPAWSDAVRAYKTKLEGRNLVFDDDLARVNLALAMTTGDAPPHDEELAPFLASAFEPYRRVTWPADDARNRAWIKAAEPLVARWGQGFAAELAKRFEAHWPSAPIRVEVSTYAGSVGAYTTRAPILVTMSSDDPAYQGQAALEMLFHEASHGLTGILEHDIEMAFVARGKTAPRALDHVIIFYTAGELAKRRLGPGYVPYAYKNGVYARGWSKMEAAVVAHWKPWLDDAIDLPTALARLADAL
jgi:hypothetical protein